MNGFAILVGCRWKLLDENCPSILFSPASDSAEFDDSFNNRTFTRDSLEVIDTTHNETSITTEEDSSHSISLPVLEAQLDDLKQQLEQVKEQFNSENFIQVLKGIVIHRVTFLKIS